MFKINPNPVFAASVFITVPGGDSQKLQLNFQHKKKSELSEFIDRARTGFTLEMVREIVASISDGEKLEGKTDSDFLSELVENYPAATGDIVSAYLKALTESRLKN